MKHTILKIQAVIVTAAMLTVLGGPLAYPAQAANTCVFTTVGTVMTLQNNCTTDATILIPNGFTLEGQFKIITAVDPVGGHFVGAVLANGGATASVNNVRIKASNLGNVCDAGADRLRGILFEGAFGSITNTRVLGVNQGASGCQEGNGIEVRNAPFDGTHPATVSVAITGNYVEGYQKTGILANGDVNVTVSNNRVFGLGPVNYIAQNGIQLGFGALGSVSGNTAKNNVYSPQTFASGGILVFSGGAGLDIGENYADYNDIGLWIAGASDANIWENRALHATFDAIALDDQGGAVDGNTLTGNTGRYSDVGIGLYGANGNELNANRALENTTVGMFLGFGSTGNVLEDNEPRTNLGDGLVVNADGNTVRGSLANVNGGIGMAIDGDGNVIENNTAKDNGLSDVQNVGANTYSGNTCDHSSGAPVDCGNSPLFDHQTSSIPDAQPFE